MAGLRPSHRRLMHWVGVGGVAILAVTAFNLAADHWGGSVPGLAQFNAYVTRKAA